MNRLSALLGIVLAIGCAQPPSEWHPSAQPSSWETDEGSVWFFQMADTQFGFAATPLLFSYLGWRWNADSFAFESTNMELAISHANRLRPAFVVLCGDLVDTPGHAGQIAEFRRISGQLDEEIPLYLVAGNHDVGSAPTHDSLSAYRATFGRDWYAFRHEGVYGIVLNSQLLHSPEHVPDEAEAQYAWLVEELEEAKASGAERIVVFQHHPMFLTDPSEDDAYFNIPRDVRARYLELFREAEVRAIFAGHYHRNAHGWDGDLEMVTTGAVGKPLGADPSGFRAVRVGGNGLDHVYFPLGAVPEFLGSGAVLSPAE